MELGSFVEFLENKTVLVTGATGFLAKIFVEKILRVQPNVKKLYLLLRAADTTSANQRFYEEVLRKDLFRVAKEKFGANLNSIIAKKIGIVAGDVFYEDLGVKDSSLREEMINDLDFVLNFAATTRFDERYDVALGTNTMGAKNVLCFAKNCLKLKLLIHVSTAYVCGESSGFVMEKPYQLGETLNGVLRLNIEEEKKLVDEKLNQLQSEKATEADIKKAMRDMGIKRAKTYGWPNTYVFTKAMGEMIVGQLKENLPVVIIRPTIVTSTYKEPFPGWIEGARTLDALITSYGRGELPFFVADLTAMVDVIPADMVVNAIIIAMMSRCDVIYHIGSSARNPLKNSKIRDYMYSFFTNKPWIRQNGKPIKVAKITVLTTMASFHSYIAIRYWPLLKVLKFADTISCHCFQGTYNTLNRRINRVIRFVDIYRPYLFFQGIFDDSNTNKLLMEAKDNGAEMDNFFFNPKSIDWDDYFMNTHIPGLVKYSFNQ